MGVFANVYIGNKFSGTLEIKSNISGKKESYKIIGFSRILTPKSKANKDKTISVVIPSHPSIFKGYIVNWCSIDKNRSVGYLAIYGFSCICYVNFYQSFLTSKCSPCKVKTVAAEFEKRKANNLFFWVGRYPTNLTYDNGKKSIKIITLNL
jgi:hypothetical protein